MSSFTWLDHSDKERRKVLEAIDRFKETDTRDELGIASIRDGFADLFFPGTGVLMTRARYYLFIPWMYLELEHRGFRDDITKRSRRIETQLIDTLGDEVGAIGRISKGALKRMPSNIYWLGLRKWGIRSFDGTQADYHRFIEMGGASLAHTNRDDDSVPLDNGLRRSWHSALPEPPSGFPKQATLDLTPSEATYLRECIQLHHPDSMLTWLLRFSELPNVDYPWLHPQFAMLPERLRAPLIHAQHFAETMQGAALLYNLMLAEADRRDTVDEFRTRLSTWAAELRQHEDELANWDLKAFWVLISSIANVPQATRAFVNHWLELRIWENEVPTLTGGVARQLIESRERGLKGRRARLTHQRALEIWGGESGTARLNYRWPTAKRLLTDIVEMLEVGKSRKLDEARHA